MKTIWLVINLTFGFIQATFKAQKDAEAYAAANGDDGSYHCDKDPLAVIPLEIIKGKDGKNKIKTSDPVAAHKKYEAECITDFLKRFGGK